MAPYIAPTAFITVAVVAAGCIPLLAAEAAALWRLAFGGPLVAPWWTRWLAVLSILAAL